MLNSSRIEMAFHLHCEYSLYTNEQGIPAYPKRLVCLLVAVGQSIAFLLG